ncbi:hypothetical protein L226DRAFT_522077 [Lentinus tigrinus ALCF2SS1-7]|uniref:Uncharacterized protein n=1 Tax=Lentinus tigrinus ALCF2SS1-6 TaxID=1328759 RepID=A0A5C2SMB0_9APHY|nr:hypothetical protein L227DRAFT_560996 [Lentinus tigrinus ALCF2SS1-6]RPD76496.1 hypothetical protein L226DRAFT_522077 [Lentinus tigrinus ALCF2SS1-7]
MLLTQPKPAQRDKLWSSDGSRVCAGPTLDINQSNSSYEARNSKKCVQLGDLLPGPYGSYGLMEWVFKNCELHQQVDHLQHKLMEVKMANVQLQDELCMQQLMAQWYSSESSSVYADPGQWYNLDQNNIGQVDDVSSAYAVPQSQNIDVLYLANPNLADTDLVQPYDQTEEGVTGCLSCQLARVLAINQKHLEVADCPILLTGDRRAIGSLLLQSSDTLQDQILPGALRMVSMSTPIQIDHMSINEEVECCNIKPHGGDECTVGPREVESLPCLGELYVREQQKILQRTGKYRNKYAYKKMGARKRRVKESESVKERRGTVRREGDGQQKEREKKSMYQSVQREMESVYRREKEVMENERGSTYKRKIESAKLESTAMNVMQYEEAQQRQRQRQRDIRRHRKRQKETERHREREIESVRANLSKRITGVITKSSNIIVLYFEEQDLESGVESEFKVRASTGS